MGISVSSAWSIDNKAIQLFIISFCALFIEMALIRIIPGYIRIVSYFSNLILIASFFGLGIGYMLANNRINMFKWFYLALFPIPALVLFFNKTAVRPTSGIEVFWLAYNKMLNDISLLPVIFLVFGIVAVFFIPLGQKMGQLFSELSPLSCYSVNIAGSIAGVVIFSLFSYLNWGPISWVISGLAPLIVLYKRYYKRYAIPSIVFVAMIIMLYAGQKPDETWSPYYKINVDTMVPELSYMLTVNDDNHQWPMHLSSSEPASKSPMQSPFYSYYNFLYQNNRYESILILGAGTGNDIDAALLNGTAQIDAVEIDPTIISIGKKIHPDKPYSDPRVTIINDDARTFINNTKKKYDLVIIGLIDSHTLHSNLPGIRLDNYIYTLESFRQLSKLLNPDRGVLSVNFCQTSKWMTERMRNMLTLAFHQQPLYIIQSTAPITIDTFLSGPGVYSGEEIKPAELKSLTAQNLPTDDWPYLYMLKRGIPMHYLIIISGILLLSCVSVYGALQNKKHFDIFFFSLGAGFMILETKAIVVLSRSFGSTWTINTVVVVTVLFFVLLGVLVISKIRRNLVGLSYGALFATIVTGWLISYYYPDILLTSPSKYYYVCISLVPTFFASIIFTHYFQRCNDRALALGSNLFGGVVGGFSEYISMYSGLNNLWWVALTFYLVSYLCKSRNKLSSINIKE